MGKKTSDNIYENTYSESNNACVVLSKLIFTWKSSIYRMIWKEFLVFGLSYAFLSILYRVILFDHEESREIFEVMCVYADKLSAIIPITFLTGFYVSQVVSRWWDQFISLPWPDKMAYHVAGFIPGKDPFNKQLRCIVMRHVNLSIVLCYRMVSSHVLKNYPDYESLVQAKLMLPHEVQSLMKAELKAPHETAGIPLLWAIKLIQRARTEGRLEMDPPVFAALTQSFDYVQDCNRKMLNYGWMNFPLAYTQVATVTVLIYFIAALFGRQFLTPREDKLDTQTFPNISVTYSTSTTFGPPHTPDFYVPFFTFVEFFCYMGWIKVAEDLLNPFGDGDQDFQVNYLIERNLRVSYLLVDDIEEECEDEELFHKLGLGGSPISKRKKVVDEVEWVNTSNKWRASMSAVY